MDLSIFQLVDNQHVALSQCNVLIYCNLCNKIRRLNKKSVLFKYMTKI